jgi:hypothetical protein
MFSHATEIDVVRTELIVRGAFFQVVVRSHGSMKGGQYGHIKEPLIFPVRIRQQKASSVVMHYVNALGKSAFQDQAVVPLVRLSGMGDFQDYLRTQVWCPATKIDGDAGRRRLALQGSLRRCKECSSQVIRVACATYRNLNPQPLKLLCQGVYDPLSAGVLKATRHWKIDVAGQKHLHATPFPQ